MNVYDKDPELKSLMDFFMSIRDQRPTFDSFMALEDESQDLDVARMKLTIRNDFIGNLVYRTLHGGLIAAMLDTTGGAAVFFHVYKKVKGKPRDFQVKKISKNATVDLRVDYLLPGTGKEFLATARILRAGNKFVVTRMELHSDQNALIAAGTATYSIA